MLAKDIKMLLLKVQLSFKGRKYCGGKEVNAGYQPFCSCPACFRKTSSSLVCCKRANKFCERKEIRRY